MWVHGHIDQQLQIIMPSINRYLSDLSDLSELSLSVAQIMDGVHGLKLMFITDCLVIATSARIIMSCLAALSNLQIAPNL
jgi:hypothetical protein